MDTTADLSSPNTIVKQELIIDDLELHDYEHLLREFYSDQPDVDHVPTAEELVKTELPDVEETFQEHFIVENPFAVQNEDSTWSLGSDGLWHCHICTKTFQWKTSCEAHIKKHRQCEVCSMTFSTPARFDKHNRLHHGILAPSLPVTQTHSPTKPSAEPAGSPGKRRLSPILMQRDENGLFTCPECGKSFEKDNSYFVHVRRHKDKQKERFFCQPCGKPLLAETDYHQHAPPEPIQVCVAPASIPEELPTPLESDSCELLIQIFDEEEAHRDETANDSGQMDLDIQENIPCFDLVSSEDNVLPSSVIVKEEFVMELEGSDDDGTALVDILHSRVEIISEIPLGGGFKRTAKPIQRPEYAQRCPVCKVWYHTVAGLEKHLRRHEQLEQGKSRKPKAVVKGEIRKEIAVPKKKSDFYCERCDKSYGSKHKYYLHKARHINIDSARFKCSQCSKVLGSKQELIIHERRTHEAPIPPKTNEENLTDLLKQAKPCTILLEDILLKQEEKLQKTLLKQSTPPLRRIRQKKGRAKGSRKCPMCYEWFLTQDELKEHYSVHINNDMHTKAEENKVKIKIKGQIQSNRLDVKQLPVPDAKEVKKFNPDSTVPERRKPGRPLGSRNLPNPLELKPRLLERRTTGRTNGSLGSVNTTQLTSEASSSECKKRRLSTGCRTSLDLKPEQTDSERRKRGRPKGYREYKSLPTIYERRKSGRRSGLELDKSKPDSLLHDGSQKDLTPDVIQPDPGLAQPRKVGRPRKSQPCPTVSASNDEPISAKRKRGRPKGSSRKLQVNPLANATPYCERCDKKFTTQNDFKFHNMRHSKVDLGRFKCDPCLKVFASKLKLDVHVRNGHKNKVGRPKKMQSLATTANVTKREMDNSPAKLEQDGDIKLHRKVGRPRKNQLMTRNFGRPKGSRKCPLCKIWSRSAEEFKEHLRSHI